MPGQWRRQAKGQQQIGAGSDAPQIVANVFDAIKLVGANPSTTPDADTLYKGLIPKARLRFNMATDAIADSFNVSSITDGGAGNDTINWDRDFSGDTTYGIVGVARSPGVFHGVLAADSYLAGSCAIVVQANGGAATDATLTTIFAFGDQ